MFLKFHLPDLLDRIWGKLNFWYFPIKSKFAHDRNAERIPVQIKPIEK